MSVRAKVFGNGRIEAGEEAIRGSLGGTDEIYMGAISHDSRPVAFPKQISNSDQRALGGARLRVVGTAAVERRAQEREKGVASLVCTH